LSAFPIKSGYLQSSFLPAGMSNPPLCIAPFSNEPLPIPVIQAGQGLLANQSFSLQNQTPTSKKRLSKWEAAKASMANSWFLGLPFGLALAVYMHHVRNNDPSEAKLATAVKNRLGKTGGKSIMLSINVISSLMASVFSWTLYGGVIGGVSAAMANHKLDSMEKQGNITSQGTLSNQSNPLNGSLNQHQAFVWGSGLFLVFGLTLEKLGHSGLFGESLKSFYKMRWQKPKFLIPAIFLLLASSITNGYLAARMVPWMQQQLNLPPTKTQKTF
jgi:hypothetical protein